jgi:hypothetical protein
MGVKGKWHWVRQGARRYSDRYGSCIESKPVKTNGLFDKHLNRFNRSQFVTVLPNILQWLVET